VLKTNPFKNQKKTRKTLLHVTGTTKADKLKESREAERYIEQSNKKEPDTETSTT